MKKLLAATILFFCCIFSLFSQDKYVYDKTQLFTVSQIDSLSKICKAIEDSTSSQVVVYTIDTDLAGTTIEEYSLNLAQGLGIGHDKTDNGLLILIIPSLRKSRIEVGYGLEGILSDARTIRIQRELFNPHFKNKEYFEGVAIGLINIHELITPDKEEVAEIKPIQTNEDPVDTWAFVLSLFGGLFTIGGTIMFFSKRSDAYAEVKSLKEYYNGKKYHVTNMGDFKNAKEVLKNMDAVFLQALALISVQRWWEYVDTCARARGSIHTLFTSIDTLYEMTKPKSSNAPSSYSVTHKRSRNVEESIYSPPPLFSNNSESNFGSSSSSSSDSSSNETSFGGGDFGGGGSTSEW